MSAAPKQKTSFHTSRGMMGVVNQDPSFVNAKRYLGFQPNVSYVMVRDYGLARTKEVIDFYLSIYLSNPSFYWASPDGTIVDDPMEVKLKVCRYISSTIKRHKPLKIQFAGKYYYQMGWGGAVKNA
jgi:hypothetical protein